MELKHTSCGIQRSVYYSINRTIFGIETYYGIGFFRGELPINRTIFGIETIVAVTTQQAVELLSIAPSLELKLVLTLACPASFCTINRTIFGIETTLPKKSLSILLLTINRTIFGIETVKNKMAMIMMCSINRTIFGIETVVEGS